MLFPPPLALQPPGACCSSSLHPSIAFALLPPLGTPGGFASAIHTPNHFFQGHFFKKCLHSVRNASTPQLMCQDPPLTKMGLAAKYTELHVPNRRAQLPPPLTCKDWLHQKNSTRFHFNSERGRRCSPPVMFSAKKFTLKLFLHSTVEKK